MRPQGAATRLFRAADSGSQKVQRESEKPVFSHLCNFLTIDVKTKNSSAIDRGPGPRSKSDEFSAGTHSIHNL